MGFFAGLKRAAGAAKQEVNSQYKENTDFLEACAATCALVAAADGTIDESEKTKAITVIAQHPTLSALYTREIIEKTVETMLKRATSSSGKMLLARELDDIKNRPNGVQMCEDAYLVALDVAGADGNVGDDEKKVLATIAKRMGVDTSKFDVL